MRFKLFVRFEELDLIEALEIQRFDPVLNIQKPDPEKYRRKNSSVLEDICWIAAIAVLGVALIALLTR